MPIIKSAKKRVKVAKKATIRNSKTKRSLKEAVKSFAKALTGGKGVKEAHSKAQSEVDKGTKKRHNAQEQGCSQEESIGSCRQGLRR